MKKIFLTGEAGIGKSTVVNKVLHLLGLSPGGFRTERCLVNGEVLGFKIVDIATDNERLIARFTERGRLVGRQPCFDEKPLPWWGRRQQGISQIKRDRALVPYPEGFEDVGVKAIKRALACRDLIVMDELGFLELEAPRFQEAVFAALKGPQPVLVVLKKAQNSFLDGIRSLEEIEVIEVREDNRDRLPGEIAEHLRGP